MEKNKSSAKLIDKPQAWITQDESTINIWRSVKLETIFWELMILNLKCV